MERMGKVVHDLPAEEEDVELDPELLAELDAAIEEADRGEGIPFEEVLRELREMREEEIRRRG
jgi:hypothetical protein